LSLCGLLLWVCALVGAVDVRGFCVRLGEGGAFFSSFYKIVRDNHLSCRGVIIEQSSWQIEHPLDPHHQFGTLLAGTPLPMAGRKLASQQAWPERDLPSS